MKKKLAVLAAGICALSLFLTGCSGEISNDYVTITKYKDVEIDKVDADAVSDNDVEAQINSVLQSKSTTTEVTDRAAQTGDTVTIDYEGKKDGVAFDGGTATDAQLTLGSGQFIDGFEDGVVGHNIGDTFECLLISILYFLCCRYFLYCLNRFCCCQMKYFSPACSCLLPSLLRYPVLLSSPDSPGFQHLPVLF